MDRKRKDFLKRQNLPPSSLCVGLTAHSKALLLFPSGYIPVGILTYLLTYSMEQSPS